MLSPPWAFIFKQKKNIHSLKERITKMIINLDDFRKTKQLNKTNTIQMTKTPIFDRIFIENNELIGEIRGSKEKVIIEHLEQKDRGTF